MLAGTREDGGYPGPRSCGRRVGRWSGLTRYDRTKKHGFIDSQKMGVEVFRGIDPQAPLIVAESVWQVQPASSAGPVYSPRADFDGGQLERHLAGVGRHAEPERVVDQNGSDVTARSGARISRTPTSRTVCNSGSRKASSPTIKAMCAIWRCCKLPPPDEATRASGWPVN